MRRFLIPILLAALAMGQTCLPSEPVPAAGPIPQGIYAGTVVHETTTTFFGRPPTDFRMELPYTAIFNQDGCLLDDDGFPLEIGHIAEGNLGPAVVREEVTGVIQSDGYFQYDADVTITYNYPILGMIETSGPATSTFIFDGQVLHYTLYVTGISETYVWGNVFCIQNGSGSLTRH